MTQITTASLNEAAARVEAAFPDRPFLTVDMYQQSNGRIAAYVGKATNTKRYCIADTIEACEAATIAKLQAE